MPAVAIYAKKKLELLLTYNNNNNHNNNNNDSNNSLLKLSCSKTTELTSTFYNLKLSKIQ